MLLSVQRCHLTRLFGFDLLSVPSPADPKKICHYFESKTCRLYLSHPVEVERQLALAMGQLKMVKGTKSYFLEIKGCSEDA